MQVLDAKGIAWEEGSNWGRLAVRGDALEAYLRSQQSEAYNRGLSWMTSVQVVKGGLALSALFAMGLIPKILEHS